MPSISVGEETERIWMVARWAYCGYLSYVSKEVSRDEELSRCIEMAVALDGLHLELLDEAIAGRLLPILIRVLDEIVSGRLPISVEGRILEERSQEQFWNSLHELKLVLQSKAVSR